MTFLHVKCKLSVVWDVENKKAKRRAGALFEFPVTKKFLEREIDFPGCQKHYFPPFIGCPNTGIECHGKGRERTEEGKSVMVNHSLFPGLPTLLLQLFRWNGKVTFEIPFKGGKRRKEGKSIKVNR